MRGLNRTASAIVLIGRKSVLIPKPRDTVESLIPDCWNTGVIFRTLLVVNVVIFIACLTQANHYRAGVMRFVESAMLLELVSILSLFILGLIRHFYLKRAEKNSAHIVQRLLCAAIPAVIAGGIILLFSTVGGALKNAIHLSLPEGMLIAALFGGLLQHYFELRARAFSPALSEARLQALQARIRPHFLFNSLNAVLSLIRVEPLRAEEMLEDLSELFRMSMREANQWNTLGDEIRLCQQYLSIEKTRLGERLSVEWDMSNMSEADIQRAKIPPLLLQPLLENAVHYGVEPSSKISPIAVRIQRVVDRVDVVVRNPIAMPAPPSGNQMALGNIRERLALMYDLEANLTYRAEDGVFEVHLRFPLERGA